MQLLAEPEAVKVLKKIVEGLRSGYLAVFQLTLEPDGVRRMYVGFDVPDYYIVREEDGLVIIEFFDEPVAGAKKVYRRDRRYSKVTLPSKLVKGKEGPVIGEIEYDSKGRKRRIILYLG